jgi:hypothetical protein
LSCKAFPRKLLRDLCPSAAAIEFSLTERRFLVRDVLAGYPVEALKLDAISGIVNMSARSGGLRLTAMRAEGFPN